jgi:hypothetical protein
MVASMRMAAARPIPNCLKSRMGRSAKTLKTPTRTWVYAEARAGRIPHVPLGRYRRFRLEAIETWVAEAEHGSGRR